jgi:hypothetical protein
MRYWRTIGHKSLVNSRLLLFYRADRFGPMVHFRIDEKEELFSCKIEGAGVEALLGDPQLALVIVDFRLDQGCQRHEIKKVFRLPKLIVE